MDMPDLCSILYLLHLEPSRLTKVKQYVQVHLYHMAK